MPSDQARERAMNPSEGHGGGGASRPAGPLDQKRENRKTTGREYLEDVAVGEFVAIPARSGGGFDPLGCRVGDVRRADDVVALVEGHPGRWLMITLTVDRSLFLFQDDTSGPEVAYAACNERVRKVGAAVARRGIYLSALELQGMTGDGWPHWHLIVWAPDSRSIEEVRAQVLEAWRFKAERIDEETGEVIEERGTPIARPHCIKVEEARTVEGIARYAAKYLVKSWPALPPWLLRSRRQPRKLRLSRACFKWLELQGRHVQHVGGRKLSKNKRRRARRLIERMAASGSCHGIFRMTEERKLRFVRVIPVPISAEGFAGLQAAGGRFVQMGKYAACRVALPASALRTLSEQESRWRLASLEFREQQREWISSQWARMQYDRERERGEVA